METAWITRTSGDNQPFNLIGSEEGTVTNYSYYTIKSMQWPG